MCISKVCKWLRNDEWYWTLILSVSSYGLIIRSTLSPLKALIEALRQICCVSHLVSVAQSCTNRKRPCCTPNPLSHLFFIPYQTYSISMCRFDKKSHRGWRCPYVTGVAPQGLVILWSLCEMCHPLKRGVIWQHYSTLPSVCMCSHPILVW